MECLNINSQILLAKLFFKEINISYFKLADSDTVYSRLSLYGNRLCPTQILWGPQNRVVSLFTMKILQRPYPMYAG